MLSVHIFRPDKLQQNTHTHRRPPLFLFSLYLSRTHSESNRLHLLHLNPAGRVENQNSPMQRKISLLSRKKKAVDQFKHVRLRKVNQNNQTKSD